MSIASEITRLQTAKANIKTSIENKGVVVSSSDKLDDYPSLIDSINISTQEKTVSPQIYTREITPDNGYRGLSKVVLDGVLVDAHESYTSTTDSDVAYTKSVPSGALSYASLDKLGGMSYKSENLLNIPDVAETTTNGITYKAENGVITFNGTATSGISIILANDINIVNSNGLCSVLFVDTHNTNPTTNVEFNYKTDGSSYYLQTRIDNGTYAQSIISRNQNADDNIIKRLGMWIPSGTVFNNCVITPMLVKGTTAPTEYQPYFTDIRNSAVISVKSYGSNLIALNDVAETTNNGITTKVENGVITINGTTTSAFNYGFQLRNPIPIGTYSSLIKVSGTTTSESNWLLSNTIYSGNNYSFGRTDGTTNTATTTQTNTHLRLYMGNGVTYTNYQIKIMLVKGSTAPTTYHPYRGLIETKTIPSEVQALPGYGWGINDTCYNYIYYEAKKFVKNVDKKAVTNDTEITKSHDDTGNGIGARVFVDSNVKVLTSNVISNLDNLGYRKIGFGNFVNGSIGYAVHNTTTINIIYVRLGANYDTAQKVKDFLVNNGIIFVYELATPVETDISQYLDDNTIEVEENGTLTFTNTYNQAVPSEVTYLVEL